MTHFLDLLDVSWTYWNISWTTLSVHYAQEKFLEAIIFQNVNTFFYNFWLSNASLAWFFHVIAMNVKLLIFIILDSTIVETFSLLFIYLNSIKKM